MTLTFASLHSLSAKYSLHPPHPLFFLSFLFFFFFFCFILSFPFHTLRLLTVFLCAFLIHLALTLSFIIMSDRTWWIFFCFLDTRDGTCSSHFLSHTLVPLSPYHTNFFSYNNNYNYLLLQNK
uniref:Uncharacterized protein n=1 Tax=Trypanosoma vivax (strain Y486) TaxID=1055687 RepID=G0UAS3_TRYVY|nr:hypothetical protein TVY486_1103930 [Trypanosoma vivax Y486]